MFYQVYHIKIFSFSFIYFSNMASVIALSILYAKHPNKHNNQQCNIKTTVKKDSNPPIHVKHGATWSTYTMFDNAIIFKHQSIFLFWFLENFLEKNKTGLPLQINITWSLFIGLIKWRSLYLSHIWSIQLLSLNVKVYIRFIIYLQISLRFIQGIIQGIQKLPCLVISFRNFILIWKYQKWSLNRGTLVSVTKQSALLQF